MIIAASNKEEITSGFDTTMKQLVDVIDSFTYDDFNKQPFEGSWTAGQVVEHLYKSVSGIPGLLQTENIEAGRDPLEKCKVIGSIFLNFEVKLKSPDFILPSDEPKQVEFFIKGFKKTREEINNLAGQKDLSRLYTRYPFPTIGELTGWEWIFFGAAHSIRHIRQLKNIHEHL